MAFTESKPITIDMKCGCGATLRVECHPGLSCDFTDLMTLATAWTAAHKPHHQEPRKGDKPARPAGGA